MLNIGGKPAGLALDAAKVELGLDAPGGVANAVHHFVEVKARDADFVGQGLRPHNTFRLLHFDHRASFCYASKRCGHLCPRTGVNNNPFSGYCPHQKWCIMEIFYTRLKELRNGRSYQAFSRVVGLPATSLERWEKGQSDIKASQLCVLSKVLSVSVDWLLGITDEQSQNVRAEVAERKLKIIKQSLQAVLEEF